MIHYDDLSETSVVNFMNDIRDAGNDGIANFADTVHMDIWKELEKKIKVRNAIWK